MLFLVRSAFWLTVVYSAMPFETEVSRSQNVPAALHDAVGGAACLNDVSRCDGLLTLTPTTAAIPPHNSAAIIRRGPPSISTLGPSDLGPPWRGGTTAKRG